MARLTDRLQRWASQPMRPGEGLHVDIFRAAIILLEDGHADEVVFSFLRKAADQVGDRPVPDREIRGAIASARQRLEGGELQTQRWPAYDEQLRTEICSHPGVTVDQLADSAEKLPQEPWPYVEQLFRPTDYVCLGQSAFSFTTKLRDQTRPLFDHWKFEYVNPSPMIDEFGLTKDGEVSAHCLGNCGPKVYQVVEFDTGHVREHAALHWYLARSAPLVALVYSGGKSMHGWYNVRGWADAEVARFFGLAVRVGADPKMWSRCQFSRLPAGTNAKTGRRQTVLLFCSAHL